MPGVEPATALFPPQERDWALPAGVPLTSLAAERLAREAAQHGFGPAARSLTLDWHTPLADAQVQRWSEVLGQALVNKRQEEITAWQRGRGPAAPLNACELVVVGMDGGRVQMREKNPDSQSRWTEDKVASFSTYLPGDGKDKKPQPLLTTYVATLAKVEGFGPQVALEAQRRGLALAKLVLNISDGAAWIDFLAEKWRVADVRIIDYYHAIEHLHAVAEAVHGPKTQASWGLWGEFKTLLWEGKVAEVIARIQAAVAAAGPAEASDGDTHPRTILRRNLGYFQKHQDHMKYDQYRAKGWPIGSGNTEAGVKCFNKRVKGSEQYWGPQGLETILALRALWLNQDQSWERYWERRTAYGFAMAA
jgi:hypothetical protein